MSSISAIISTLDRLCIAETLDRFKEKFKTTKKETTCDMIVDEMSIRQQTIWNGKKYEGFVDLGIETADSNETATQACYPVGLRKWLENAISIFFNYELDSGNEHKYN